MPSSVKRFHHGNPHPGALHAQMPEDVEQRKLGPVPHVQCPICGRHMLRHGNDFYCPRVRAGEPVHGGFRMNREHCPVFGKLPTDGTLRAALDYREDVMAQFADVQKAEYSKYIRQQVTGRTRGKGGQWSTGGGEDE